MARLIAPTASFDFFGYNFNGQNWTCMWDYNAVPFLTDTSNGYFDSAATCKGLSFSGMGVLGASGTHPMDLVGNPTGLVVMGIGALDVDMFDVNVDFHTQVFATEASLGWQEATPTAVSATGTISGLLTDTDPMFANTYTDNLIDCDGALTLTVDSDGTNSMVFTFPHVNFHRVGISAPAAGFRRVSYSYHNRGPFSVAVAGGIGLPYSTTALGVTAFDPASCVGLLILGTDANNIGPTGWFMNGVPSTVNINRPFGPGAVTTYSVSGYSTGAISNTAPTEG